MSDLNVSASVSVDGKKAEDGLKKIVGTISDTKVALEQAQRAANATNAELKKLDTTTAAGAARAAELTSQLRDLRLVEYQAAEASKAATDALTQHNAALGRVTTSSGQARAATANLGQQVGDIAQGFALGVSPMTIFAQQGGQVAFAMSGMGGKIGAVATFLSGPWGAAITGAAIVLGSLAAAHAKAGEGADKQGDAEKALKKVLDELDAASGRNNRTTEESIRLGTAAAESALKQAAAERVKLQARLESARAEVAARQRQAADPAFANEAGINLSGALAGLASRDAAGIEAQIATNAAGQATLNAQIRAGAFKTAQIAATAATSAAAKANLEYERTETAVQKAVVAGALSRQQAETQLVAAIKTRDSAIDASRQATKDAAAATRQATKDASDYARSLQAIQTSAGRAVSAITALAAGAGVPMGLKEAADKQNEADRQASGVGPAVAAIDEARAERFATKAAKTFTASTLADAAVIGQAIGGGLGRAFTSIAALGFGKARSNGTMGDFTGVGGRLETLLSPLADAFGNGGKRIAGLIGQAAGGAATGSVISGIGDALGIKNSKAGASIGGALGSFAPFPGGEIVGSILGGLVGGLFGKSTTGSATISSSSGRAAKSGNSGDAISNAVGLAGQVQSGIEAIAQQLGGSVRDFGKLAVGSINGYYGVNLNGDTIGKNNSVGFGNSANSAADAMNYAITVALERGAIANLSPRVQATLKSYTDNVQKGLQEALKVKGLEDLLADRKNPFLSVFRTLEQQLQQRVDVARKYGFDLVEIEKLNGEDRAKALQDTLAQATGSVRSLLTDLTIGSGATGSASERLAKLGAERDRLTALAKGGDSGQLDAIASVVKQIDDLARETYGSTAGFASSRADSVSLLNDLIKQTEDRAKAAADEARANGQATVDKLTEANASLDDLVAGISTNNTLLTQIAGALAGGIGVSDYGFGLSAVDAR